MGQNKKGICDAEATARKIFRSSGCRRSDVPAAATCRINWLPVLRIYGSLARSLRRRPALPRLSSAGHQVTRWPNHRLSGRLERAARRQRGRCRSRILPELDRPRNRRQARNYTARLPYTGFHARGHVGQSSRAPASEARRGGRRKIRGKINANQAELKK